MLFDKFDHLSEICDAGCLCAIMSRGYKVIDGEFIIVKERMDVLLVDDAGALCLWEDEVQEEEESEPGVERDPKKGILISRSSRGMLDLEVFPYQTRMNPAHDSNSNAQANTTQYMSHGVKSAGSEVLRAL